MNSLKGKTAVITGAGRGIGFAIVQRMLEEGMNVFATSRDISKLEALGNEKLFAYSADLTDTQAPAGIIEKCVCTFGGVDVIINNAGYAKKLLLSDTSAQEFDKHMAVNVRAPLLLVNAALPWLEKSKHAAVVNICSVVAEKGYETQGAYTASKHALLGYTKVLAKELFDKDIRVHALLPGGVSTELIRETRPDLNMDDLSTPQEIADIILFLVGNRGNSVIDQISVRRYTKQPWA